MSQLHPQPIKKYLLTIRAPAWHIQGIQRDLIHNLRYVGPLTAICSKKKGPQIEKGRSFSILFAFSLQNHVFTIFALNTVIFSVVYLRIHIIIFDILFLWLPVSEYPKLRERFTQKWLVSPGLQVWLDSKGKDAQNVNLLGAKIG